VLKAYRELETKGLAAGMPGQGTFVRATLTQVALYAWTQGFGRARWTIAKLVIIAVTVTVSAFAFSELFDWFFKPFLAQEDLTVLSATVFAREGIAYAAWTLLAFSVGALAGMFFRRIVPAMAVTLGIYIGLAILTWTVLRKHYPVALTTSGRVPFSNGPMTPNMPWVLRTWTTGHTQWVSYIPVSRFWPMQLIEGGWLLALSILLMAATVWLVRHRAA
jgi:hypothetical protein